MWGYVSNFFLMMIYLIGFDKKRQNELASRIGWGLDRAYVGGYDETAPALQAGIMSLLWFLVVMDIKKIWPFNKAMEAQ